MELPTCGAEDLVVFKALAGRARDGLDIEGIVSRHEATLDTAPIRRELPPLLGLAEDVGSEAKLRRLLRFPCCSSIAQGPGPRAPHERERHGPSRGRRPVSGDVRVTDGTRVVESTRRAVCSGAVVDDTGNDGTCQLAAPDGRRESPRIPGAVREMESAPGAQPGIAAARA